MKKDEWNIQWLIDLRNDNGDTIREDYFTGTYEEAVEEAAWQSIVYRAADFSVRNVDEI